MIELINKLEKNDIHVSLEGNELKVGFKGDTLDESLLNELREHKESLVKYLKKYQGSQEDNEIPALPVQESYLLSPAQQRLWVLSQFEQNQLAYHMPFRKSLNSNIDVAILNKAFNLLIDRHESLRTVFREDENGSVRQYIREKGTFDFEVANKDFTNAPNKQQLVEEVILNDNLEPYNLSDGPLFRAILCKLKANQFLLYFNMHHIISDGWSLEILTRDLSHIYDALIRQEPVQLPQLRIQYKDYANWQLKQLSPDGKNNALRSFWTERFKEEIPVVDLPFSLTRPPYKTTNGGNLEWLFSKEDTQKLNDFCKQRNGSLFMTLLAGLNVLLYKYTGIPDHTIGTPVSGRNHAMLEDQIGFYVNTLAIRNKMDPSQSFSAFFEQVKDNTLESISKGTYPFDQLVNELKLTRDLSRNPLFDISLTLQNMGFSEKHIAVDEQAVGKIKDAGKSAAKFDLDIICQEVGEHLYFGVNYNTDLYLKADIERIIVDFRFLILELLEKVEYPLGEISLLSGEELKKLDKFNATDVDYSTESFIPAQIAAQSEKNPNNIALVFEDQELSYADLNHISDGFSDQLYAAGIRKGDMVPVLLERSFDLLAAITGILKLGAVYVPVDRNYPDKRIREIFDQVSATIVIADPEWKSTNNLENIEVISSADLRETSGVKREPVSFSENDPAYVIFTSGTTGKPKGVVNTHGGLRNRLAWMRDELKTNNTDVFLQKTPFTFDVSVWELLLPLATGAKLVIANPEKHKDIDEIARLIKEHQVSIIHFVPSMLKAFLTVEDTSDLKTLKHVICSGEALPYNVAQTFSDRFSANLHNYYGPTEAAIDVTSIKIDRNVLENKEISIGKPAPNCQIYIADQYMNLQPAGIPGEVLIGGKQLALGYLNNKELTSATFIESPFKAGETLYRTGDIGKWDQDGNIILAGRKDDQVKVRGHRIELAEVERAVLKDNTVSDAVVLVKMDEDGNNNLICFFKSEEAKNSLDLMKSLKNEIPEYMIPSHYFQVEEIPVTGNGKADKKRLLNAENLVIRTGTEYKAPVSEVEKTVVAICKELLKHENISLNDNLFALGAHSLTMVQLASALSKEFDIKITVDFLFREPVIKAFCDEIEKINWVNSQSDHGEETETFLV